MSNFDFFQRKLLVTLDITPVRQSDPAEWTDRGGIESGQKLKRTNLREPAYRQFCFLIFKILKEGLDRMGKK